MHKKSKCVGFWLLFGNTWNNHVDVTDSLVGFSRDDRRDGRKPKKPYKYWDVAPVGYEHMTPVQYKALQGSCDDFCIFYCGNVCKMLYRYSNN